MRLGIISSAVEFVTRHYLAPFRRSYPKALFELHESNSYHLLDLLHSNQIDLAVIRTPFAKAGLEMQTLPPEAFLAIGREMIWSHYQECPNALLTDIPPSDTGSVIQSSHPMPASDASEPQKAIRPHLFPSPPSPARRSFFTAAGSR
ncbi:MAG: LysR substrate-binding domain-containing protein [Clostridium fessum]